MRDRKSVEIMAPAGGFDSLSAALSAGADSVYFGVGSLNMRSRSSANFSLDDLNYIAKKCRKNGVKSYLALNTIVYDEDIQTMKEALDAALSAGVDAVIACDPSALRYASSIGIPVHMSVQANVANIEAVKFYANYADVMVLARELTLDQICYITEKIKREKICGPSGELVRVELFAHGALCVSISGKCYMSLSVYNASGNRGGCFQNCRRRYRVTDEETGEELVVENKFVMSPKDICTIKVLDKLIESGVSVFKLEGRGRSADYVYTVTSAYRKCVDKILERNGKVEPDFLNKLTEELETVFNRGFWDGGYYLGKTEEMWSGYSGNRATLKKTHIGHITNFFSKISVCEINLKAGGLKQGDLILVTGNTTGSVKFKVDGIHLGGKLVDKAEKGDIISLKTQIKLRRNDKVYLLEERCNESVPNN